MTFRAGSIARLNDLQGRIEFIQASILDSTRLSEAMRGVDVIFHQGAWASVPQSVELPMEYHDVDATGTLNVLECARKGGCTADCLCGLFQRLRRSA